jgi:hypothetical protein
MKLFLKSGLIALFLLLVNDEAMAQAGIASAVHAATQNPTQSVAQTAEEPALPSTRSASTQTAAGTTTQEAKEKAAKSAVTVPIFSGGFLIGASGLLMVPSAADRTTYGALNTVKFAFSSHTINPSVLTFLSLGPLRSTNSLETGPQYSKGFALHTGYRFPGTGNDVLINWNHLNTGHVAYSAASGVNLAIAPQGTFIDGNFITPFIGNIDFLTGLSSELGNTAPFTYVTGRSSTRWNTVDLSFGQHVQVGNVVDIRFASGLVWAQINNKLQAGYAGFNPNQSTVLDDFDEFETTVDFHDSALSVNEESMFTGVGPEIGIDGHYCYLDTDWSLAGHLGAQMLVGSIDSILRYTVFNNGSVTNITNTPFVVTDLSAELFSHEMKDNQRFRLVPELDANLSIDYTYNFANPCPTSFIMKLGYEAREYFNAIRSFNDINGNSLEATKMYFHGPFFTMEFLI